MSCGLCREADNLKSCPCRSIKYCSKDCQNGDWQRHRHICKLRKALTSKKIKPHPSVSWDDKDIFYNCADLQQQAKTANAIGSNIGTVMRDAIIQCEQDIRYFCKLFLDAANSAATNAEFSEVTTLFQERAAWCFRKTAPQSNITAQKAFQWMADHMYLDVPLSAIREIAKSCATCCSSENLAILQSPDTSGIDLIRILSEESERALPGILNTCWMLKKPLTGIDKTTFYVYIGVICESLKM